MIGALASLGAAALTMIGMLQDLLTAKIFTQTITITSWDIRVETNGGPGGGMTGGPFNGVPLLFAVVVLLAAAVLGMLAAARPARTRFGRASALAAVVAAAFLAGTVATIGMQVLGWMDAFTIPDNPDQVTVGPGFWTLVVGVGLAIAAAVTTWRQAGPEPARVEPDTPRLGIPVVVQRLPDEPPVNE
jgi:hypothetical protein